MTAPDDLHKPGKLHSAMASLGEPQATSQLVSVNTGERAPPSITQPEASDWCDGVGLYARAGVGPSAGPVISTTGNCVVAAWSKYSPSFACRIHLPRCGTSYIAHFKTHLGDTLLSCPLVWQYWAQKDYSQVSISSPAHLFYSKSNELRYNKKRQWSSRKGGDSFHLGNTSNSNGNRRRSSEKFTKELLKVMGNKGT